MPILLLVSGGGGGVKLLELQQALQMPSRLSVGSLPPMKSIAQASDLGPIKFDANQTLKMPIEWRIKLTQFAYDFAIHLRMRTTFARV